MDYRILGSFEVRTEGRLVGLGGEKPRALLAILLLHRNEVVSADRLIDDLWGESPPETALRTLRAYVSRLRKALGANGAPPDESDRASGADGGVLVTQGHGYVLRVAPGELDVERFGEMADRGREALAARKPREAAAMLSEALGIWRGPPLTDFAYEPFAQSSIAQLEELHLAAIEDRVEADLALGRARNLVGELRDLVARQPLRERLRGQLMLALYRSGRQAEALEVFQEFRRTLSEELGLEPGPAIQQLELSILSRDPALDLAAGDAASEAGGELWTAAAPGRVVAIGRRRLTLAVGAAGLLILVLAAVVMAAGGGRATELSGIPGDAVGAISPSGGAIRAVVSLGTAPSVLAAGDGAVWVANGNAGTVSRIDPSTRAVVETIPVGSSPSGIAVAPGAVWVTDNYGNAVSRIDPAVDRVVQTIPVGNAPTGVAVADGSVWVVNSSDGSLTRIDAVTGDLVKTIPVGAGATDVAVGAGAVWVSDEAGDHVFRVDPRTDQVTAVINVGTGPTASARSSGRLPTRTVRVTASVTGSIRSIVPAYWLETQTPPSPNATAPAPSPTATVSVTVSVCGSIRETVPSRLLATHTDPNPTASAVGPVPTLITAVT